MRLDAEQLAFFRREGYLVVPDALDPAGLQPAIDEITESIHALAVEAAARGNLSRTYANEPFETRLWKIHQEYEDLYWSVIFGRLQGRGIFALVTNDELLDLAESIVGPEIIGSAVYRLRPKLPGHWHGEVPWHQDSGYFEPVCDNELILTVWVPFVDATVERGCLEVMPGVHGGGVVRHQQLAAGEEGRRAYLEIAEDDLPGDRVTPVPVDRGGVVLLTNRTPHRSTPNRSGVIRWSIDIRYQSADLPTNFPPLAQPRNGQIDGQTGGRADGQTDGRAGGGAPAEPGATCYPPEADFLVRSRSRPQAVVRSWEAFDELRRSHRPADSTARWE